MPTPIDDVVAEALKLSAQDRAEVIERLADTLSPAPPLHPAWDAEIARRVAEMDAGQAPGIAAEQVFAELRARIEGHGRGV